MRITFEKQNIRTIKKKREHSKKSLIILNEFMNNESERERERERTAQKVRV